MMADMSAEDGVEEPAPDALVIAPPDPRRLREDLAGPAGRLFAEAVETGGIEPDDPRVQSDGADHASLLTLSALGLLRQDGDSAWLPTDPSTVQSWLVAPLTREVQRLLEESRAWAETLDTLGQTYRTVGTGEEGLTQLRGLDTVNGFLESAVEDARMEILTAHPAGARRASVQAMARSRDVRALQRGVRLRTLYQHTARHSRSMREYVDAMREVGAEIRTLDEFFNRLIVIDRRLALIPGDVPESAVLIHDRRVVAYLVDVFERSWERGRDYDHETRSTKGQIAEEVRALTVRMLAEGHSDSASAKRVGVSTRTYATYVAALKAEFGVDTRFQLGLAMGRADDTALPDDAPSYDAERPGGDA